MKVFRRLLKFLSAYRWGVWISLALGALAMGMGVLIPFLVGRTVDAIGGPNPHLWPFALAILAAGVLRLGLSVTRRVVAGKVSLGVEYDLRNLLYGHLQELELAFFDTQQTGQLMSRSTVDLQSVRFFLGYGLVFILQSAVAIAVAASVMLWVNPGLAAVALSPAPLVLWQAFRYGTRNRPALQEVQQRLAELTAEAEENISGVRVVKAFAQEVRQLERFSRATSRVFEQSMLSARLRSVYNPTLSFLPNLGLAAVLLVGGSEAIAGTISVGDFVAFYGYVVMLTSPLRMLGVALGMAQRAVASGARIFEILDRQATLTAPRSPRPMPEGSGHIEMRGVSFSHNGSGPILSEINLDVQAGKTVALVGPTGAGKTTLAALIPRLYDATTGSVSVDGTDVRLVDPSALRREIALVSDDPFLFSQSLRDNIAYARPDATQPEIELAAQQAGLRDFVAELSEGYDTLIGERGLTLSGGQRQRVAIARALLKDPRILILDDATSSIDATTETQIRLALAEIMRDRTTIVIAHRLSTIALADEIVVLANGAIASRGTHSELLTNSSLYRDIVAKGLPETVFFTATEGTGAAGL